MAMSYNFEKGTIILQGSGTDEGIGVSNVNLVEMIKETKKLMAESKLSMSDERRLRILEEFVEIM